MQMLKPLSLPLQGQILIEASAGTGKTYTIGLLFLRLLLERKLSVDEILVVTFTKAATEELRGRIRLRIREALTALEPRTAPGAPDSLLQALIDGLDDHNEARILLSDALVRMDEAMISTIHGFCQRMLQVYAFESGAPFEMDFIESESALRQQIIEDFWRGQFYDLDQNQTEQILQFWSSPEQLLKALGARPGDPAVICVPIIEPGEIAENQSRLSSEFARIVDLWPSHRDEVIELLSSNKRLARSVKTYGSVPLTAAISAMDTLVSAGHTQGLWPDEIALFTRSKMEDSFKPCSKADPPEHLWFDLFDKVYGLYQEVVAQQKNSLLLAARHYLAEQLTLRKQRQAQMYFDDLLNGLDSALQGPDGAQFAARIGKQLPVILVDEFQDTDPLQYRIFSQIHNAMIADKKRPAGLFLIGDPKQAIYAFRGADIFTYLKAREDTPEANRFTMACNYRSTPAVVGAVNQLFSHPQPFYFDSIHYPAVSAGGTAATTPLTLEDEPLAAMHCLLLTDLQQDKPLNIGDARVRAVEYCAAEISKLLNAGQQARAQIGKRALSASDIAILVRTHAEASQVRQALQRLDIASVYLSQESIFESPEAQQLCQLLETLENLSHEARIRTTLASPFFGYSAVRLDNLFKDEQRWLTVLAQMARYRDLIRDRGFALFFQTLIAEQELVKRLQPEADSERCITNFLHLAELLQSNTSDADLPGILSWLNTQIQSPEKQAEAQQLRLESDENLVRIVTIHAAKGLQYSVVFLPFLWSARACRKDEALSFHFPDKPEQLVVDLGSGKPKHYQLAEQERLAEDLRLLYVAVTRAQYACYFCWGNIKDMALSAMHYLLHSNTPALHEALCALRSEHGDIIIHDYAENPATPLPTEHIEQPLLTVKTFDGQIDRRWRITSYSGLTTHRTSVTEQPDYDLPAVATSHTQAGGLTAFGFPRGADAGICLHAIMEHISFTDTETHAAVIEDQLARAAYPEQWNTVVADWLHAILNTPLTNRQKLSDLNHCSRIDEMAFYFPLESVDTRAFNHILRQHRYPPLPKHNTLLHGLMIGFVDLVFEHQGQYFIADYKSNHLGDRPEDYQSQHLQAAMDEHRYDLQYLIYSVALHRYLGSKIPDYRYEQHFGGIYYLFLRGMSPDYPPGNGVYYRCPDADLIRQLDDLFSGEEIDHG